MKPEKHVVMKYSLAKALMDAGVHHFDSGGGVISAGNSNPLSGISGALTTQNSFNATAPTNSATVGTQQEQLAGQLQNEAAGNGPNPAQIQYEQNAQTIAQQQAALNAQNRSLNPGLAARLSSNAAVQSGQSAAGGAAAQQAEQQLAAQQQMEGLTGQEQTGALQAAGINAQVAQNNTNSVNNTEGGLLNSVGGVLGSIFAKGGKVPDHISKMASIYHAKKYAGGGSIQIPGLPNFSNANNLPPPMKSPVSSMMSSPGGSPTPASPNASLGSNPLGISGVSSTSAAPAMSSVPALGSSAGIGAPAAAPSLGIGTLAADPEVAALALKAGGSVPGKAKVKGDSYKNDTVPALVSPGEEVIDRETLQDPGPIGKMARTVAAHINQKNSQGKAADFMNSLQEKASKKDDSQKGYQKIADAKRKRGKK